MRSCCTQAITIDYTYDGLYRLAAADYASTGLRQAQPDGSAQRSDGTFYHYTYDSVGNRLTQDTQDGTHNTYTYDAANRLTSMTTGDTVDLFAYNGFGDRVQQTVDGVPITYTLDLNAGLTQVLSDGTHTYLYGFGRIAQVNTTTEYFLGDALGSVRQLVDADGEITLSQAYQPWPQRFFILPTA